MNEFDRELESALKEQIERVEKLRNQLKEISSLQETLSGTGDSLAQTSDGIKKLATRMEDATKLFIESVDSLGKIASDFQKIEPLKLQERIVGEINNSQESTIKEINAVLEKHTETLKDAASSSASKLYADLLKDSIRINDEIKSEISRSQETISKEIKSHADKQSTTLSKLIGIGVSLLILILIAVFLLYTSSY